MTSFLWILLLANLLGTPIAQDLNLADAFGDGDIPPTKPPVKPAPPKNSSPDDFDLAGALDFDDPEKPAVNPPKEDPKKPTGDGFDLSDALGPDTEPKKPVVKPPEGGGTVSGGGNLDDKDLLDVMDGEDGYKPDGGKSGGRAAVSEHEGGASDQPQGGALAGIISSVGVALIGAASGYIAYQKKKLCFKIQGGQDPESGKTQHGGTSDNQVFSNLLNSS
ncbi:CD99 molecule isoform X1 [Triplophysa dalaica]|uniref:CD99 molecule isoform X1 n=1 Tax=Triplophysa dalaica TaxID=1582913 RepID=UPI0024DF6653|nr:CD99 molecule isoform X1 [Triplophysa dalaica]